MDFSSITAGQWSFVAVVWLAMMVGKAMSMESRVLSALLLGAIVVPTNFVPVALALLVAAMTVKLVHVWKSWS
jgi:hypothetical protein